MQISKEQKKAALIIGGAALFVTASILIDSVFQEAPEPNVTCEMEAPASQNSPRLSVVPFPIRKITISGFIDRPFEGELYDFEGTAITYSDDIIVDRLARGSVFLDDNNHIDALTLSLETDLHSQTSLSLVTLNESGRLDSSQDTIFAFEKKEFKLSYPMEYQCKVDKQRLGLNARDQRKQDLFEEYLPWFAVSR